MVFCIADFQRLFLLFGRLGVLGVYPKHCPGWVWEWGDGVGRVGCTHGTAWGAQGGFPSLGSAGLLPLLTASLQPLSIPALTQGPGPVLPPSVRFLNHFPVAFNPHRLHFGELQRTSLLSEQKIKFFDVMLLH